MKLFIPTCTLNFNNIFSTESISPKAHYATRGFGNRRYYSVEANSLDMAVTLYSKYPVFQVDDADLENYPMVIEIDTDGKDIIVSNKKQRISSSVLSAKIGNDNISERYGILSKQSIKIHETSDNFTVRLPIIHKKGT